MKWFAAAALGALTGLAGLALIVVFVLSFRAREPERSQDWSHRAQG